jgi:hypothetical protein
MPAGSSRDERLDLPSIPLFFNARDERADGGLRQVEITPEHVIIRRSVQSIGMMLKVRVAEYFAITLRAAPAEDNMPGAWVLWLAHRDRSLSVPLYVSADAEEINRAGQDWSAYFNRPDLIETGGVGTMPGPSEFMADPAPRRRRRNAIRNRRPRFLVRRKPGVSRGQIKPAQEEDAFNEEDVTDLGLL